MKYKAEVFDQVQRLFDVNGFNDHQLHCVLRFEAEAAPDADVLREAVLASIEAYPILGVRYLDAARPYRESSTGRIWREPSSSRTRRRNSTRFCSRAQTKGAVRRSESAC